MTAEVEIQERIDKCQKILGQDPNSQIFAALADAYRKKGDLDRAFRVCQNGLKTHPAYGSAHVVMSKINLDRGLYDWAEAEVNKAIELDGVSRASELLLAEIHIYKGEFSKAAAILKRLHQSDPDDPQITKLLDIALKLPEEQKALIEPAGEPVADDHSDRGAGETPEAVSEVGRLGSAGVLKEALRIPHLQGALFINLEGLVVESEWKSRLDAAACGATFTELGRVLETELAKTPFGYSSTVLIENKDIILLMVCVEDGLFLFVAGISCSLGGFRMKISELIGRYSSS